jgi:ribosomal protein S18 acetylase RimI-like enzyme
MAVMAEPITIRALGAADLQAYKALRDAMLAAYPDAFTSEAAAEVRKPATTYASRFGLDRPEDGHFTLGAWLGDRLVGAITCDREQRSKTRHIGHLVGMMVDTGAQGRGVGHALLDAFLEAARRCDGLEMITLTVTSTNAAAIALYRRAGFEPYGTQRRAIKVGARYHDKDHMVLVL